MGYLAGYLRGLAKQAAGEGAQPPRQAVELATKTDKWLAKNDNTPATRINSYGKGAKERTAYLTKATEGIDPGKGTVAGANPELGKYQLDRMKKDIARYSSVRSLPGYAEMIKKVMHAPTREAQVRAQPRGRGGDERAKAARQYDILRKYLNPQQAFDAMGEEKDLQDRIKTMIADGVITAQNKGPASNNMVG